MPLARIAATCAALALCPSAVAAQEFLSRIEVEDLMREQAFCYHPNDRLACSWAEIYTALYDDHVVLHTANAVWDAPMEVQEYRLNWEGDALCIPYENQGLRAMWEAEGYRFSFDLLGLTPLPDEILPERIEMLRETAPRDFCFRYTIDDAGPDALFQHVFRDGVEDEARDPVALIPRFASGVAIIPSG
ncbi:hypothetical protein [Gymnodinialimonas ulvae]|uniref:hypothetical protein n=1 Tax=Gymnodinialimonas ulvae TaxID=3126504 RepID=UPI00309516A9